MTVRQLLSSLDAHELSEWMAYDRLDPIGYIRGDIGAGIIAATIANVNRTSRSKAYAPTDFMPHFEEAPAQSEAEMLGVVQAMVNRGDQHPSD